MSAALQYMSDLWGVGRGGHPHGARALPLAIPEEQIATCCVAYTEPKLQVLTRLTSSGSTSLTVRPREVDDHFPRRVARQVRRPGDWGA